MKKIELCAGQHRSTTISPDDHRQNEEHSLHSGHSKRAGEVKDALACIKALAVYLHYHVVLVRDGDLIP